MAAELEVADGWDMNVDMMASESNGVAQTASTAGPASAADSDLQMAAAARLVREPGAFRPTIAEERFQEVASKVIDCKNLVRPGEFGGQDELWQEWKYKFEALAGMLDLDGALRVVEKNQPGEINVLEVEYPLRSKFLFNVLIGLCRGRALGIVRDGAPQCGFEAWARLLQEYEPNLASRRMSVLTAVLSPTLAEATFREDLMAWERVVMRYEVLTGARVPSDLKCAIVMKSAPVTVKSYLQTASTSVLDDYDQLREILRLWQVKLQIYSGDWPAPSGTGAVPMEIGVVQKLQFAGPKGKGKGKLKGKKGVPAAVKVTYGGIQNAGCWICGTMGHQAKNCPKATPARPPPETVHR